MNNKGHTVAKCKSLYTVIGKYIGEGEPPPNHYWTKKNAEENFPLNERIVSLHTADITNISEPVATNSKPSVWNVDSLNLDLEQ